MLVPIKLVHPRPGKVKDYVKLTYTIILRWHLLDLEQLSLKTSRLVPELPVRLLCTTLSLFLEEIRN